MGVIDEVPTPIENLDTPTGSIAVGADRLVMCNSTPNLDAFAKCGITRFEAAGLEPPRVSRLVFTSHSECCNEVQGTATFDESGHEVLLCLDELTTCRDDLCTAYRMSARHVLLHEFAHAWMADNLDGEDEARFAEQVGLASWNDLDLPWDERAIERAAETIAWGLLDQPFAPIFIGRPSVAELTEGFRLLTGVEPIQPAPSSTR